MQILFRDMKKGIVKVMTQSLDDLWILYNIIKSGDIVGARTTRRVVKRDGDKGERKPMYLELRAEKAEFHEYSNRLRIKGQIISGPDDYVSIGQYHTINTEVGTKLMIIKEQWFRHEIKRLEKSSTSGVNKVIMVVALESGLATIGLISNYSLTIIATIRKNIPGKRYSKQNFGLAMKSFYDDLTKVILENKEQNNIDLAILCGPGFLKEQYQEILKEILNKEKIELNTKILSASSGTQSAIYEILKNGDIASIISDHRISKETELVEQFIERLGKDNGLFTYGSEETLKAAELGAVQDLMVTDVKMRELGSEKMKNIEKLFRAVEKGQGTIHILSTMHPAGEQVEHYGGVISLLRYKLI